jgi:hypothetical protein
VTGAEWVAPWAEGALRPVPDAFSFAGVAFHLERPGAQGPLQLPACLGHPMAGDPAGRVAATVHLRLEVDAQLPRARGRRSFEVTPTPEGMRVTHGRGDARLERGPAGTYRGVATLPPDTGGAGEMDLLQSVAIAAVSDAGGAVLHAAAVALDGRACLYVGPPDAGKSTACAHTEGPLLAIDRVALVPDGAGFVAWAIPGGPEDEHGGARAAPPVAPAGWILRVVQARDEVRFRLLPPARATMVIRAAMQWPWLDPNGENRALDTAARVAAGVATGEIHTVLGRPNADAVRGVEGSTGG